MRAIILGGAACVWKDLQQLQPWPADIIGINEAGRDYTGRLAHWVTLHPEKLGRWRAGRAGNQDYQAHAHRRATGCGPVVLHNHWGGSSGLFAVKVALELQYTEIVLCGVPMDPQPHYHRPGRWPAFRLYRRHWAKHLDQIAPHVRSMSGWTRELLGAPDHAEADKQASPVRGRVPEGQQRDPGSDPRRL